jgi:hypothetical protein
VLQSGEKIDLAIVLLQRHAPVDTDRHYRLASEIVSIMASPFALPLKVRVATAHAEEYRMGFAPTLIELPSGQLNALNWTQNFFVHERCAAADVLLSTQQYDWGNSPKVYAGTPGVTYFVADPDEV